MKLPLRCLALLLFVATALVASAASTALVTPSSTTYSSAGSSITVTVNLNYDTTLSALDFSVSTPAASGAWKVPSVVGPNIPQTIPNPEDLGAGGLGFVFTDIPAHAASFSFTLSYPAGMTGEKVIPYTVNFTDESGKVVTVKAAIRLSPAA